VGEGEGHWVSLLPNPFLPEFPYDDYSLVMGAGGVEMTYVRKEHRVYTRLPFLPCFNVYNPSTVDAFFSGIRPRVVNSFFLFSSFDWGETGYSTRGDPIYYLSSCPPMVGGRAIQGGQLFDIAGSETYLSRRHKLKLIAAEEGLEVAPLLDHGPYQVSLTDNHPVPSDYPSTYEVNGSEIHTVGNDLRWGEGHPPGDARDVVHIYSPVLPGGGMRVFPIGGMVEAPASYGTNTFWYLPPHPGKYFVFRRASDIAVFQLTVVRTLHAYVFNRAFSCSAEEYPVADHTTLAVSICYAQGSSASIGQGGVTPEDMARRFSLPLKSAQVALRSAPGIIRVPAKGDLFVAVSLQLEEFEVDGQSVQFRNLWEKWKERRSMIVASRDVPRLSLILSYAGMPCVREDPREGGFRMSAAPPRETRRPKGAMVGEWEIVPTIDHRLDSGEFVS